MVLTVFTGCFNFNIAIENSQSQTENKSISIQNISYDKNGKETATVENEIFHKSSKKIKLNKKFQNKIKSLEDRYFDLILVLSSYKKENSNHKKLKEFQKKYIDIRSELKKIKDFQEIIKKSSKRQQKMAQFYFKARKTCDRERFQLEFKGQSYDFIERSYKLCQKKENGFDLKLHRKFMKDTKRFKAKIKEEMTVNRLTLIQNIILSNLEKIPQFQKDINKIQKQIEQSMIIKKEMENIYLESHKICENQKIEDEFRSNNKNYIENRYKLCVDRINISFNKQKHSKYIKDIEIFHQKKIKEIEELQSLIDQKDILEVEKEYIDEAINMLLEEIDIGY